MPIGTLTIDQTPCRESYGVKNQGVFWREFTAQVRAEVIETIATISAEGTRMSRIETGEKALLALSAEYVARDESKDVTVKAVDRPIVNYYPTPHGGIDIFV